jgi:hypothetical protein
MDVETISSICFEESDNEESANVQYFYQKEQLERSSM